MMMMMMIDDEAGVPSCRRQHVERPSVPRHICAVTGSFETVSRLCSLFTYYNLLLLFYSFFWHFLWTLQ